jgi:elongation factor P hydroxylase
MKDSIIAKLESLKERYEELEALLGDASVISDQCFEEEYNTRLVKGGDEPIYIPANERNGRNGN